MIYSPEFWSRERGSRQGQDAVRACGQLCTRPRHGRGIRPCRSLAGVGRIGETSLPVPTAHRLLRQGGRPGVNTGSLLNRLNFFAGPRPAIKCAARAATSSALLGGRFFERSEGRARPALCMFFLGGQAAPTTVATLQKQLENPQVVQGEIGRPGKTSRLGAW